MSWKTYNVHLPRWTRPVWQAWRGWDGLRCRRRNATPVSSASISTPWPSIIQNVNASLWMNGLGASQTSLHTCPGKKRFPRLNRGSSVGGAAETGKKFWVFYGYNRDGCSMGTISNCTPIVTSRSVARTFSVHYLYGSKSTSSGAGGVRF